ncbi:MAG: hypothetical protein H6Q33_704 [Deltaproteobacteria bacterium]|nr:hypothetical protein [Deltaproteobacteria bacterium]
MRHSNAGTESAPPASAASSATALAAVLDPAFLRKLDRLHLTVRRSLSTRPGNTPMPRGAQGTGIELENYKAYGAGDDLRHLDWNAYGRLDQLLIKTFRAEREAPLQLFIDASASMAAPVRDQKFAFSLCLAASLAYVSLRRNDPVRILGLGEAWPRGFLGSPVFRHRDVLLQVRDFLLQLRPRGRTALGAGIAAALREQRSPGVAVVLSDFLTAPELYEPGLRELVTRRYTVAALRVIGPAERDPATLFRRGRLTDVETGRQRFITLSADNLARYRQALETHLDRLRDFCRRCEIAYATIDTSPGLDDALFRTFPALGLLQ